MNLSTAPLRLREKLLIQGAHYLSDTELLAIFISSGNSKKSCLQLAYDVMKQFGDLRTLLNADFRQFNQVAGLGLVRYLQLQASKEICRRSDFISLKEKITLTNSHETYTFLKRQLRDKRNETFSALFLDSQHQIIHYEELFQGTINAANIYIRPLIERILTLNAQALILAHNHPSGVSEASQPDVAMTKRLRSALNLIDVQLLDHLVIGDNEVFSILNKVKYVCH
ncbi:DNA repair protein RadC [Legionella beliardensis]|uniref:DNA repair protein RadC n=1 Tax=Legionella beliardensis TaxID=91822 RepID=A0A378HZZ4_9GAMM|nr:DNA repair protein RadC [Legionella beliardensis]STX27876.1 DNA repair protein RadC [Legionella beliardensis]